MLVLTRKVGERIQIGPNVVVTVTEVAGGQVRLGIDAPKEVAIVRGELVEEVLETNKDAIAPALDREALQNLLKK